MTSRLHRIEISNFKAFRHFILAPEGRHLLVYGANGSGKPPWTNFKPSTPSASSKARHETARNRAGDEPTQPRSGHST